MQDVRKCTSVLPPPPHKPNLRTLCGIYIHVRTPLCVIAIVFIFYCMYVSASFLFVCAPSGASTSRAYVFWHCKDQIIPNLSHLSVSVITCFIYSLCLFNFFCLWNKGRWQRCPKQGIIMMWRRAAAALPAQAGRFSSDGWYFVN